ncbi:alpha/beta fold hydrolase [Phormidium tenue FACHB-886]|nr:alpha/beta fold hydrolase [Phormidium tenue FACHB-886]
MQQTPEDQYVWVGDIKTRYWSLGDRGTAVILLHGIGSCVETWTLNMLELAQHHRVYAVDLMGSGRSDKPSGTYALTDLTAFVKAFIDVLAIDRPSLIGNSMGGGIALQFALTYPQDVAALVLVNSLGLGQRISPSLRLANLPFVDKLYKPTRISTALFLKQIIFDQSLVTDEWIDLFHEILTLPGAREALFAQIRTNIGLRGVRPAVYRPILDRLQTITAPTLVVWGKQDPVLPVSQAQAAQRLPNVRFHLFDACGHWTHLEQAKEFNAQVLQFLSNVSNA